MRPLRSETSPNTALNREKVLRAAIRLGDEKGLAGVEVMSLYNHVANKDDSGDNPGVRLAKAPRRQAAL